MSRTRINNEEKSDGSLRNRVNDLTEMIGRGRSFSARERNCCFLNTGSSNDGPRFANVSAVSGLDWPDDGRGIAVVDWDADGDLDVWFSNRNAPRVRLMRNDSPYKMNSISLRLVGNGKNTNRDGIGARVDVVVTDGQTRTLGRTLRAGEGFISQSSKWLHFGLGGADRIERLQVRWPNATGLAGNVEIFEGVRSGGRFILKQGSGIAVAQEPRTQSNVLAPGIPKLPEPESNIRIPTISRLRLLPMQFPNPNTGRDVIPGSGRTVWINLWASWCAPCRKELTEITQRAADLQQAGIDVVALSIDGLDLDNGNIEEARRFLSKLRFPFAASAASGFAVDYFDLLDGRLVALSQPLPVPTSFLIGPEGDVEFIYKGPVSVDQVLKDAQTPRTSLKQRWLAAAPFGGTLINKPSDSRAVKTREAAVLYRLGLSMTEINAAGGLDNARHHFLAALALRPDFSEAHYQIGSIDAMQGNVEQAMKHFRLAIELNPQSASAYFGLSQMNLTSGKFLAAIENLREAIRNHADDTFENAKLTRMGDSPEALEHFKRTLFVQRRVAWEMATSRDARERDGKEAVRWSERLVAETNRREPYMLMTLAAALAEVRKFDKAVTTAGEALEHAKEAPMKPAERQRFIQRAESQLALYEDQKPFRQPVRQPAVKNTPKQPSPPQDEGAEKALSPGS